MARRMDFRKLKLGEYTAPSSSCLCQRFRAVRLTGYRSVKERA